MPDFTDSLKPAYDGVAALEGERSGSILDVESLSKHLLSRGGFLERQKKICKVLEGEKLFDKSQQMNLSRPDRYHLGLARAKAIRRLVHKHNWDHEDAKMAEYLTDEMSPFHLHLTMFVTTIREQASDEQKAYWMPKIMDWSIIGCYAQSELGHGSNVQGLETTATWDPKTKEFEIHSPTLTASKWWNGSMGRTATHAIVVAQILIPTPNSPASLKSHGPHPFIIQIRDSTAHVPLPGIVVGDIGPKYGYASMDNGYMLFDHFRVPKSAMLGRYANLSNSTGVFSKLGHPGLLYGSLTFVRANIIMQARLVLARAVTVAVRYLCVRRQFQDRDASSTSAPEMKVLDYPTVQIRILPLLATTFALHYTGEMMFELYGSTRDSIERGDFSTIAELHSASSGLKSLCTTLAADGIETCRRAMGGHGFGGGSGLVGINADYLSKPTVEGDNWMITQQVAAYLIKKMTKAVEKPDSPPADSLDELFQMYLKDRGHRKSQNVIDGTEIDDKAIVEVFQWRAADLSYRAYLARVVEKKPWNSLLIQLHELSRVYSEQILTTTFHRALTSPSSRLDAPIPSVLLNCFRLYTLHTLSLSPLPFLTSLAISLPTLELLPDTILSLMSALRPHAVKLVDAWAIPEYLLDSALGRYDGRVYEDLYHRAHRKNQVLNDTVFNVDWRSEEVVLGSGDGKRILSKL